MATDECRSFAGSGWWASWTCRTTRGPGKTFTTTAILQQVAAGNLKLESTIGEVLPDLAAKYPPIKDITVEQLAGMTSGIPDYGNTGVVIDQVVTDPQRV